MTVNADGTFTGWSAAGGFCSSRSNYKVYVAGKFEKPAKAVVLRKDGAVIEKGVETHGKKTSAWFNFGGERQVVLKVGLSFVSEANARENLDKEIAGLGLRCGACQGAGDVERVAGQAGG